MIEVKNVPPHRRVVKEEPRKKEGLNKKKEPKKKDVTKVRKMLHPSRQRKKSRLLRPKK
jgi:hypothetical protein